MEDLIAQPNASVLQASRDDAAVQGLYKFWSNRRIPPAAILSGHIDQTVERCRNNSKLRIVAIRDGQSVRYYGTDVALDITERTFEFAVRVAKLC